MYPARLTMPLRTLSRQELVSLASVPEEAARTRWRLALSPPSREEAPLVAMLEDWSEFAGLDWPTMVRQIFSAHGQVEQYFLERRPATPESVAAFYDET